MAPWMLGAILMLGGGAATAADKEGEDLGQIAGAYLYAADFVAQFRQSRCGKVVPIETDGIEHILDDIARYVSPADLAGLKAFLKSKELRDARRDNRKMFEEWYHSFAEKGLDEQARCTVIARNVAKVYRRSREKWNRAKRAGAPPNN